MPDTVTVIYVDTVKTNWADVADRAIDAGTSAVAELSELVKGVAPEVWEIAMRQAYVNVIGPFVTDFLTLIALSIVLLSFKNRMLTAWERDKDWPNFFSWTVGMVTGFFLIFTLYDLGLIVKVMINPKYYAIKLIADMV